jgi:hypothetical protein
MRRTNRRGPNRVSNSRLRAFVLVLSSLLSACGRQPPVASPPPAAAAIPVISACRVTPDGAPPDPAAMSQVADRGIGGTGAPAMHLADRGIGGTGIVAVITGFASVCLGGQEVAVDRAAQVLVGERIARPGELRAGQVAVVDAVGTPGALRARRIAVRYEVIGPVEAADAEGLRVAGQMVAWTPTTWGNRPAPGMWVAVSGLRRADGVIEATRVDPAGAGPVLVRGILLRDQGGLRIGALPIRVSPVLIVPDGDVLVTGTLEGGALHAQRVEPDLLASDPPALFGAGVGAIFIESFVVASGDRVRFGQGFSAAAPGFSAFGQRRTVMALERGAGGLRATGMTQAAPTLPGAGPMSPRGFTPAPLPERSLRGPGENGRRSPEGSAGGRNQPTGGPRSPENGPPGPGPMPRFR